MRFDTQEFFSLSLTLSLNGRSHQHTMRENTTYYVLLLLLYNKIGLQGFFFPVDFLPVCSGTDQELKKSQLDCNPPAY